MTSPRVVCAGEALVDLLPAGDDGRAWLAAPGGSPASAAVAAGRLGAPSSFVGVLSTDRFGTLLRDHLEASHVDVSHCPVTDEPTTLAVVDGGPGDEPRFAFHLAGTTTLSSRVGDLHLPAELGVFHASGSVSLVREPAASRLEALLAAARHRALVHLDPNPRPGLAGGRDAYLARLRRWLTLADVVKVSTADLAWLHPGADPVGVARAWLRPGGVDHGSASDDPDPDHPDAPAAVVVTRGAGGATVVVADGEVSVPAVPVEVVDPVGAGDAFAGAVLAALSAHRVAHRRDLARLDATWWRTALTFAVEAAGIACTRPGADPPWRDELA